MGIFWQGGKLLVTGGYIVDHGSYMRIITVIWDRVGSGDAYAFKHFRKKLIKSGRNPKPESRQLTLLNAGGGSRSPPYHINVVPKKMLKEKVANFL